MNTSPLIGTAELAAVLGRDDVLVVDCRHQLADPTASKLAWQEGHIPGAVHASLDHDLSDLDKTGEGRHPLPDADSFMAWLAGIGWTPAQHVIAYDDAGGALAAARLWWMLRLIGHDKVQVLDGGLGAWMRNSGPLEASSSIINASAPLEKSWSADQLVGVQGLQRGLADGSMLLVDARAEPRFRGEIEPIDKVAGHVPGARNRPFSANLDDDGMFTDAAQLREDWLALINGRRPEEVVHMCGSGVTACHNLLAMEQAGLSGSRLYAPSWSGWISDSSRAVAQGV